jgi:hypothetical protein
MKKTSIILILLSVLVSSCNGQISDLEDCKEHLKKSKKIFNSFYKEQNQKILNEALSEVELSQNCPETRLASVELKISILFAKKEYDIAYKFIKSLSKDDFIKPYKKDMQFNFFKALDYESKSDIKNRNIYLLKASNEVDKYIKNYKTIDQEAYYDLFFIKSKILNKEEFNSYINGIIIKNPSEKQFFEILRQSFDKQTKQIGNVSN